MYSASQLEKVTTCCLIDCQLTRHLPKKKRIPLVLLLVSMSPTWSLSLYPTRCASLGHTSGSRGHGRESLQHSCTRQGVPQLEGEKP
jgi:hypothetical protein